MVLSRKRNPADAVRKLSLGTTLPDGTPVRILPHGAVRCAAHLSGSSLRQIEIEALRAGIIPERYLRNFRTLSATDQARLLETKVSMVGLGGLGGPILEGLARLGFGMVKAADHDRFEPSNLNRQTLACQDTLDAPKAAAARERIRAVNPAVELTVLERFIEPEAFEEFFSGADLAIDALGGLACRPAAEHGAARAGVPLISASVAGSTAMAATVLPGGKGFASLFCPAGGTAGSSGSGYGSGSTSATRGFEPDAGPRSAEGFSTGSAEDTLGCLVPAIHVAVGLVLSEAVRLALGRPPLLGGPGGRMAVIDLDSLLLDRFLLS